tara:strand:- start:813 stop:1514 length:702 start_codon:yes stop_codon:yes gene_type:complete
MEIYDGLKIVDLALKYEDTLVIGDLQLGYEEYLNGKGVFVPRFQTDDILNRIRKILKRCKGIKRIVFNGDIKHEFGKISRQEWDSVKKLICELVEKYEVVMVKGNHDVLLEPILDKYGEKIKLVNEFVLGDLLIAHGDKEILNSQSKKVIVIAHEHPAVGFSERPGEKFKCFLRGKWKGSVLIVLPSFCDLIEGSDIREEKKLSPYLQGNISNFEVFVVEDTVYNFGKLKNIK